jgi:hypothetical protein
MLPFDSPKGDKPDKQTRHHYVLAHIALRRACLADPYTFFEVMASPERHDFLDDLWKRICVNCDEDGHAQFSSRDVKITTTRIKQYPAVLLQMPTPYFMAEAYMVCIVLKIPFEEMQQRKDNPQIQYFTLEKGMNAGTGEDRTVLCEWKGECHLNHGNAPEATPAAFMEALNGLI